MAFDNNLNEGIIVNDSALVDDSTNGSLNDNKAFSDNQLASNNTFLDESDNSTNDDSVNDNSINNSGNTDVDVQVAIGSGNVDESDNSHNNSFNDYDDSMNDYDNSFNDITKVDNSINVGMRQYNTNVGNDYHFAGGAAGGGVAAMSAGGGEVWVDNRTTVVDQSVNQNIESEGGVGQFFGQSANVASGDMSVAAGGNATVDNSQTAISVGDVSIGNEWYSYSADNSFNTEVNYTENDYSIEIDDSFNSFEQNNSIDVGFEDSFNDDFEYSESNSIDWENTGNFFSPGGVAGNGDIDV